MWVNFQSDQRNVSLPLTVHDLVHKTKEDISVCLIHPYEERSGDTTCFNENTLKKGTFTQTKNFVKGLEVGDHI